jgi:hypothetical protein
MTIGQIKDSLMPLLEDAADAESYLDNNPHSQFARRTYIRSIFSCIEGTIWILKDVCFNAKPIKGKRTMSVAEYALLKEESFELKNSGEPSTSAKFLRLPDNIKFTFKTINKLFRSEIDLKIDKKDWTDFLESLEIRHRITHPKKAISFVITDKEIERCKNTSSWFNELTHESMQAFLKSGTQNNAQ